MLVENKLIRGERVILRPYEAGFTESELYCLYQWSRDETVLRWSGGTALSMSFEEFKLAFHSELECEDHYGRNFSLLTANGEFIGRLGYYHIDHRRGEAELGIVIGEKAYWGRGYGTDAVNALLAHIFQETDLERVYLYTYADNKRAQRSFEKCGFRKSEEYRKFSLNHGPYDEVQMEIYRDEWVAQQRGSEIR